VDLAKELCDGRLVLTLEGGYHLDALAYSVLNTVAVLMDDDDWQLVDPLGPSPFNERSVTDVIAQVKGVHGI
jgi:acetoin utilization deacetylase AcuC-like enzyme